MGKVSRAKPHLNLAEIRQEMRKTIGFWRVQKWLVIYNAFVHPRPAAEIAKSTGLSEASVHAIISAYNKHGPDSLNTIGKGGRYRQLLSLDEERLFIQPFVVKQRSGLSVSARDIQKRFVSRFGRSIHISTVYRMLKRHQDSQF